MSDEKLLNSVLKLDIRNKKLKWFEFNLTDRAT